jgi:peptidoglycan hydrolase CwlO-like protein
MTETQILQDIRERVVRLETKLDNLNDVKEKVDKMETKITETEARSKSNTHRIDKIEANNTWLWRTIAGLIIAAVVSTVLVI